MLWWRLRQLRSKHWQTRKQGVEKLGNSRDARAVSPLIAMLKDEHRDVRDAAIGALAEIGTAALDLVVAALKDKGSPPNVGFSLVSVGEAAAEVLGKIGDARAVEPLATALREPHMRATAARSLGKIGSASAVQPLVAALRDERDYNYRQKAIVGALIKIGAAAVEPLVTVLKDGDWNMRYSASGALGEIGDTYAVRPLIAALKDENRNVRRVAAEALGKIGDTLADEPLVAALEDQYMQVWKAAAVALKSLGWQPKDDSQRALYAVALRDWNEAVALGTVAIKPLRAMLEDEGEDEDAAWALYRLGDTRGTKVLVGLLVKRAADPKRANFAVFRLTRILEESASLVALDDLRTLSTLDLVYQIGCNSSGCGPAHIKWLVPDQFRLKQLARQELIRRGEDA